MLNKSLCIPAACQNETFLSVVVDPFRESARKGQVQRQEWKPKTQHRNVCSGNMQGPTETDPKFWQIPKIRKFLESSGSPPRLNPSHFTCRRYQVLLLLLFILFVGDGSVGPWRAHVAVQ